MNSISKFFKILALVSMISIFMAGCNTMEGMGKDIQGLGKGVQDLFD